MQKGKFNLQDLFLNEARKKGLQLDVYLISGPQLKGMVKSFDNFTFLLEDDDRQQLVYKHAVTTIIPTDSAEKIIHPAHKEHGGDGEST